MATKYKGKIVSAQGEGGPVYKFREVQPGEHPAVVYNVVLEGGGDIRNQDKTITENGQYTADAGYTGLGTVTVNVSGGGIPSYMPPKEIVNGVFKNPNTATSYSIAPATDVGEYALARAFYNCTNLTSVDLSSLTTISGQGAMDSCFWYCTHITSVDLSSLTTISGGSAMNYSFYNCTNLTSVDLSSLTTISSVNGMVSCFQACSGLTSVDLSSLTTVTGSTALNSCFANCTNLTSVSFPVLATLDSSNAMASCFQNCSNLPKISFPALTTIHNQAFGSASYNWCFRSCPALTEIHFRADARAAVEATAGYADKWGATNATIYFDL